MIQKLFVVLLLASGIAAAASQHLQQFPGPSPNPHLQ